MVEALKATRCCAVSGEGLGSARPSEGRGIEPDGVLHGLELGEQ
jgi:hypothetical protein